MIRRVAVIDIGSNSIKALVAESDGTRYGVRPIREGTREVRISTGIAGSEPLLREKDIQAGTDAVNGLYRDCIDHGPIAATRIVATSAVRSAKNGQILLDRIRERTGVTPAVISGQEEADGIAMGVRSDPAVGGQYSEFTVFDLGGGSMELIHFADNQITASVSLSLGSVRLTEMFISHPADPLPEQEITRLTHHLRESIKNADIPLKAPLIGCSGGLTMWRAIRATAAGVAIRESTAIFSKADIDQMIQQVVRRDLHHRIEAAHIPPQRADIFPVALITFRVLLELFKTSEIQHSLHNLRYGLAWSLLQD